MYQTQPRLLRDATRGKTDMKHKINITFDILTVHQQVVSSIIRRCIEATLSAQGIPVGCEINVLVTNDRGIHAINKGSRGIDKPTDVLSFPMFELAPGDPPKHWAPYLDPDSGLCPLGDMCISLQRAVAQAKEYGHSSRREVGYLTIHSMLHLLGYDHMDEGEMKRQMREREEAIAASIPGMQRN